MFNFGYISKEDITVHNPNWSGIPDHPYRILILAGSRSEKTNALLNQINHEPDIDKIYLYTKDTYKAKYQLLICKSILMIQKLLLENKKTIQKKWEILYLKIWLMICLVIKNSIQ